MAIFFLAIAGGFIALYFYGQDTRKNHSLAVGKVLSYDGGGRGNSGPGIYYVYEVDGLPIYSSMRKGRLNYGPKGLVNHYFPVVYRKGLLGYFDIILIAPYDFEYYGYTFPDSLRWVLPYLNRR